MAQKLVPDNQENLNTCHNFIDIWDEICEIPAKTLSYYYSGIEMTVSKKKGVISWEARFLAHEGKDLIINENNYKKLWEKYYEL